ncbi:hypothetical protein [Paracoccus sp. 22332]|uniref:hypothetical protein n=1 Tax=Paracoccus sp. 22332 TaxID=3453913 RepID=UPI003F83C4AD
MTGDNFNNYGTNNGHIGPVNNYGKQEFQLTPEVLRSLLTLDKTEVIRLAYVSTRRSEQIAYQIADFLVQNGYTVDGMRGVGHLMPPLRKPIEMRLGMLCVDASV